MARSLDGAVAPAGAASKAGRVRWTICALLFFAVTINYIDRQMIGVLKPTLQTQFAWTESTYADIIFSFQLAYALGYIVWGRLVDKIGARWGYSLAALIWGVAALSHAGARSAMGFMAARFGLGLGEAGNFPAGLKAIAEWFPKKERALATGIFNAGSNVGAIITPLVAPVLVLTFGWQAAFFFTPFLIAIWIASWVHIYRRPREKTNLSAEELAYIESDPADVGGSTPWRRLLGVKETWAYAIGKFLIDPIWWMWLFWLPDFFSKQYGLDLKSFGPPLVAVYILSDIGSIAGGWLSSTLIKRGYSVNAARKLAMLICALGVPPVILAMYGVNLWMAVLVLGLAAAAHQGFSANLYTIPSDMFPRRAVGSVVGIGGTIGAVGGMFMAKFTGFVLDTTGSYLPMFIIAASAYLLALLVIHLLSPRLDPVKDI